MTEDEAKTKWCPFSRTANYDNTATNRNIKGDGLVTARCLGSACMAWRATDNESEPFAPGMPEPKSKPAGFCGLAGRT